MQKKGISLIVLVITIIVMIILAATVVISLTSSSVIDRANQAVQLTDEKQVQDLAAITWSEMYLDNHRDDDLRREVMEKLVEQGVDTNKYHIVVSNTGVSVSTTPTKVTTLAGTKWKFNENISDYDFLGVFDFEEQNGYERFENEAVANVGDVNHDVWGIAILEFFNIRCLTLIKPLIQSTAFNYIPANEIGVEEGWYAIRNEEDGSPFFGEGEVTLESVMPYISDSEAPTITFANESEAAVENPELINWLYENATKIG